MLNTSQKIAFLGFGEAARAFVLGWQGLPSTDFAAFDIKCQGADNDVSELAASLATLNATESTSPKNAARGASAIFSLVTADQALVGAKSVAQDLPENCWYFDCNSCAPDTKIAAAQLIQAAGGRYVDVAVMAPVHPALHKTPLLISGEHSQAALAFLEALDMKPTVIDGPVGKASSIKMIRSVMMKGLEALVAECVLAGRNVGVDDIVLQSLEETYPGFGWQERANHMLERMTEHGLRRAAEMREVALTVDHLGVANPMATAAIQWQQAIGDLGLDAGPDGYQGRADRILAALAKTSSGKT